MDIKTDSGRILVVSDKPFGAYGYTDNWYKIHGKNRLYIICNKTKMYLEDLEQVEDYTWIYNHSTGETKSVSQFKIK